MHDYNVINSNSKFFWINWKYYYGLYNYELVVDISHRIVWIYNS